MFKLLNINLDKRIVGLDVMRSVAILSVVFGHFINLFYTHLDPVIPFTHLSIKRFVYYIVMGFDGVDLFFVLSGFLIGHSLLDAFIKNKLNFKYLMHNFWIKRWFRTLPNYLILLLVLFGLSFFVPVVNEDHSGQIPLYKYFIFLQNITRGELVFFPESWSLSIEEWFYISFPIILTIVGFFSFYSKIKKYLLLSVILCFISVGIFMRVFYTNHADFGIIHDSLWNADIRTSIIMRIDAIIYGVLMAYFKIYFQSLFIKLRYVFLFLGAFILVYAFNKMFLNAFPLEALKFSHGYYFSFVGIGMAMLLPWFYHLKIRSLFLIHFFTFISVISYSVYLVNYTLVKHSVEYFIVDTSLKICILKCLLCLFFTVIISMLLYKFIEMPFMNLRKKIIRE